MIMKFMYKIIVAVVILIIPEISYGQYCNNFHENNCYSGGRSYNLNGQSRSSLFDKGETSELNILVYKKMDYRISVCVTENLGERVFFKISEVNKVRVKRIVEGDTVVTTERRKQVLYDNSDDEFSTEIEFSAESTKRLVIEISTPGGAPVSSAPVKNKLLKRRKIGCMGVLIEHKSTPVSGF